MLTSNHTVSRPSLSHHQPHARFTRPVPVAAHCNNSSLAHSNAHDTTTTFPRRIMLSLLPSLLLLTNHSPLSAAHANSPPALTTPSPDETSPPAPSPRLLVLVVGSTGQTGRRLVGELRARGFRVLAGSRDVKKAQGLGLSLDKGVQLVEADVLKPEQLEKALSEYGRVDAVVCATGYTGFNPSGFGEIDETGTLNLIQAAKKAQVGRFVLLTSLLTNAPNVGQGDNPNYKFLNLFGSVLDHKLVAEKALRASGLTWTVIRPGGLSNDSADKFGNLVVSGEDTLFGTWWCLVRTLFLAPRGRVRSREILWQRSLLLLLSRKRRKTRSLRSFRASLHPLTIKRQCGSKSKSSLTRMILLFYTD